jgi:glycosyltransferase involved in cell wall biosynthesis
MNAKNPLVSVIITTYNSEKFIKDTVNSVLNQTFKDFELIIADDGSSDATIEIAKNFISEQPGIILHSIKHTGKPALVRNSGAEISKGEFIAFLDGDDFWEKHKLDEQIKALRNFPEAVFAYSASVTVGNINLLSPFYEVLPLQYKAAHTREELIQKGNSITLSSVLIRKKFFKMCGGFDEDPQLKVEDYDLWLRLSELGNFIFVPRIHTYYRVHQNQFSADWETKKERLDYLSQKRKLNLPQYRFYRNKALPFLLVRNLVHFSNYLWLKLSAVINRYS